MTKFYVDPAGVYLGGYDGARPPANAIEIAGPPEHGWQVWGFPGWQDTPALVALRAAEAAEFTPEDLAAALKAKGAVTDADIAAAKAARLAK